MTSGYLVQLISKYVSATSRLYNIQDQVNAIRTRIYEQARTEGFTEQEIRNIVKRKDVT